MSLINTTCDYSSDYFGLDLRLMIPDTEYKDGLSGKARKHIKS